MSAEFRPHGLRAWVTLLDEAPLPVLPNRLKPLNYQTTRIQPG